MELIGYLGGILLSLCAVPLSYQAWKDKHADGVNIWFLHLWFTGEVLTLVYVLSEDALLLPLIANYIFNILCILVVYWYKMGNR